MGKSFICTVILSMSLMLVLAACQQASTNDTAIDTPIPGLVTDMSRFDNFIAGRPTPEQFRWAYPDVLLVLPGDITTLELRDNNSRFFAELDDSGRIVGGRFQ